MGAAVHGLEEGDALVIAGARQQHPGRYGASLTRVHARRHAEQRGDREVRVFEDDGRRLAPQLEEQPLHRLRPLFHDPLADHGRAGERDQVDLRRKRQLLTHEVIRRGDHVDDPRRESVCSATNRPSRVALNGVLGAGLNTTVLPVASAWPSFLRVTSNGKFHGTIAPTTPTGSRQTFRVVICPGELDERVAELGLPRIFVDQRCRVRQRVLRVVHRAAGRASSPGGSRPRG